MQHACPKTYSEASAAAPAFGTKFVQAEQLRIQWLGLWLVAATALPIFAASAYLLRVALSSSKFWQVTDAPLSATLAFAAIAVVSLGALATPIGGKAAERFAIGYLCGMLALLALRAFSAAAPEWTEVLSVPYSWFFPARTVIVVLTVWIALLLLALTFNPARTYPARRNRTSP